MRSTTSLIDFFSQERGIQEREYLFGLDQSEFLATSERGWFQFIERGSEVGSGIGSELDFQLITLAEPALEMLDIAYALEFSIDHDA